MYLSGYRCTLCGHEYEYKEDMLTCEQCGEKGILDIVFDYAAIAKVFSRATLNADRTNSMWRYRALLPVTGHGWEKYLRVGFTPYYRAKRLGELLGVKALHVKDDGLNPTGSLKDRASAVAVMRAIELGYETVSCASTGNAASSLAGNAARMGLKAAIFVPERAPKGKVAQLLIFGAKVVLVKGNYRDTFELSRAAIEKWGFYNRNAGINPILIEGKKTVALEIAEQSLFDPPDWVAVSVGDGCTIGGVYNGFRDLLALGMIERIPKILGVQSTGCCPFVTAQDTNAALLPAEENTIADSISVGVPRNPEKAMRAVTLSGGRYIAVPDEAILAAMRMLGRTEGLFGEPAAVTALAGVSAAIEAGIVRADERVCMLSTGSGLKDVHNAMKAAGEPMTCTPALDALEQTAIFDD